MVLRRFVNHRALFCFQESPMRVVMIRKGGMSVILPRCCSKCSAGHFELIMKAGSLYDFRCARAGSLFNFEYHRFLPFACRFDNSEGVYFITFTVAEWVNVVCGRKEQACAGKSETFASIKSSKCPAEHFEQHQGPEASEGGYLLQKCFHILFPFLFIIPQIILMPRKRVGFQRLLPLQVFKDVVNLPPAHLVIFLSVEQKRWAFH